MVFWVQSERAINSEPVFEESVPHREKINRSGSDV